MITGLKSVTLCLSQLCKHACGTQFNNTMERRRASVCTKTHLHLPGAAKDTQVVDVVVIRQVLYSVQREIKGQRTWAGMRN